VTNIDDVIAARIAEAARRREAAKQRRAELQAARDAGLVQRHATKLRRLAECAPEGRLLCPPEEPVPVRVTSCPSCRRERIAQRVAGVVISGAPHDVLRCSDPSCELTWCVRADRPRVPVAAA
jgi:hypothetical protein